MKIEFGEKQEVEIRAMDSHQLIIHMYSPGQVMHLWLTKSEAEVLATALSGAAAEMEKYLGRKEGA
jgi:hypothetical protein